MSTRQERLTWYRAVDAYHTCYNLSGLSAAQHTMEYYEKTSDSESYPLSAGFRWQCHSGAEPEDHHHSLTDMTDKVLPLNPVYVIPLGLAEAARKKCEGLS